MFYSHIYHLFAGGFTIEKQCNNELEKHRGQPLFQGDIFTTEAGDLPSKLLIHAVLPMWDSNDSSKCVQLLESIVSQCLKKANDDNLKTVAFPPLGLGYQGFPDKISANIIICGVVKYFKTSRYTSVKTVTICSMNEAMFRVCRETAKHKISDG